MSSFSFDPDEGIIDVEKRTKQANYTLGDPTIFPPEFLAWLKRYIEQSGITLPASAIFGTFQAGINSVRSMAPGIILPYGSSTVPQGALACDGSAVLRTTYAGLFAVIGTTWGVGDGSTTFNLPDLQGRVAVGKGTNVDVDALNDSDGSALADRRPKHKHTKNGSASMTGSNSSIGLTGSNSSISLTGSNSSIGLGGSNSSLGGSWVGGGATLANVNYVTGGGGTAWHDGDFFGMTGANSSLGLTGSNSSLSLTGSNSSFSLTGSNSTIGVSDTITVGPQTTSPTDGPAYTTVLYIITTG